MNYYERSLAITRQLGHHLEEMYTYVNLSASATGQGIASEALTWAQKALEFSTNTHDRVAQGWAHFYLGHAYLLDMQFENASQTFKQCIEIRNEVNAPALVIEARAGLVDAYTALNDQLGASTEAERIVQYMEKDKNFEGTEEPLRVYLSLFSFFQKIRDPRAQSVLQNAIELLDKQVSKLRSDEAQRTFVENVPWRRALRKEVAR